MCVLFCQVKSFLHGVQETNPFTYVEINGLRIPEPAAAYGVLWEAVSGHDVAEEGHLKIGPKEALKSLTRHFGGRKGPGGHAWCVGCAVSSCAGLTTYGLLVSCSWTNWIN